MSNVSPIGQIIPLRRNLCLLCAAVWIGTPIISICGIGWAIAWWLA